MDTTLPLTPSAPVPTSLDVRWIHGVPGGGPNLDPPIQVHAAADHTFILRQSMAVHHEAPFLYLLCGTDRALLLDTGATSHADLFPLRPTVDATLGPWLAGHPRETYGLVVAHSHGHDDHVAADDQFADRPATQLIPPEIDAMTSAFGMARWPEDVGQMDLGGRVLQVIATPGHHPAAISVYDPWTGFLLTGDTVYPGRLYVADAAAYTASLERLVAFAQRHPVTHVLGCHVELTTDPGRDFPLGARHQPGERPLPMTVSQLTSVRDAMRGRAAERGIHVFDDFIVYNAPRPWSLLRQVGRSILRRWAG